MKTNKSNKINTKATATGLWSQQEHERYLAALNPFISWSDMARRVGTRSTLQCRTHHQKIDKKMRQAKQSGRRKGGAPRVEHRVPTENEMLTAVVYSKPNKAPVSPTMNKPVSPSGVDEWEWMNAIQLEDPNINLQLEDTNSNFQLDMDALWSVLCLDGVPEGAF